MKKAQSAMEYLMTYGWAILIVIIVAAALFALGVFNPSTYTGRAATGFGEMGTPADWQYSGGNISIVLKNQVGQAITVTNVTTQSCSFGGLTSISAGGQEQFDLAGCTAKGVGDSYSESVIVTYSIAGGLPRTASGTITGTATA